MYVQLALFPDYPSLPPPPPPLTEQEWYESAWARLNYPEEDDIPMCQNTQQGEIIVYVKTVLDTCLARLKNGLVAADLMIYRTLSTEEHIARGRKIDQESLAPDVMLVTGVATVEKRGSYDRSKEEEKLRKKWRAENGTQMPQSEIDIRMFVVEVMSPSNYADKRDIYKRLCFYSREGVDEYLVIHTKPNLWLDMYTKTNGTLARMFNSDTHESALAKVSFGIEQGELVLRTQTGDVFEHYEDEREMRISAQSLVKSTAEALEKEREAKEKAERNTFAERKAKEKAEWTLLLERQEEANTLAEAEAKYKAMQEKFYELQQLIALQNS